MAAEVLTILQITCELSGKLRDEFHTWRTFEKTFEQLAVHLGLTCCTLHQIQEDEGKCPGQYSGLEEYISMNLTTCEDLQALVKKCTKHSAPDHKSIRDYLTFRWKGKTFEEYLGLLKTFHRPLSFDVQVKTL